MKKNIKLLNTIEDKEFYTNFRIAILQSMCALAICILVTFL